jgi:hypothetical protein
VLSALPQSWGPNLTFIDEIAGVSLAKKIKGMKSEGTGDSAKTLRKTPEAL